MMSAPDLAERTEKLKAAFKRQYGLDPEYMAHAPGRVNLIGEHTDYNEGFVFPAAIDRDMMIATREAAAEAYASESTKAVSVDECFSNDFVK